MEGVGASVNQFLDEFGNLGTGGPLLRETLDLLLGGDLTSEEQPEEGLGKGLGATGGGGELLLALGDGLAAETDTLVGVEDGAFPNQTLGSEYVGLQECIGHDIGEFGHLGERWKI